jgi:hypothetical protein
VLVAGFNTGDGSVIITDLTPSTPIPESASLAFFGTGVAGLLVLRRRKSAVLRCRQRMAETSVDGARTQQR